MRPAKLTCPYARYDGQMQIHCEKVSDACTHQRWCMGKGWSVLTENAERCSARKEVITPITKHKRGTKGE